MMEGEEDGERRCSLIDLNFNFSGSSDCAIIHNNTLYHFYFDF